MEKGASLNSGESHTNGVRVSLEDNSLQLTHISLLPQDGRDQEEDAVAQVRDGRALQDHRRLRGGHQGGCRQG